MDERYWYVSKNVTARCHAPMSLPLFDCASGLRVGAAGYLRGAK